MSLALAKKPSHDNGHKQRSIAVRDFSKNYQTTNLSFSQSTIQRKPVCPCGGGCPRCKGDHTIQTKLKINEPGDKYEQEADRVADQVMRMSEPSLQRQIKQQQERVAQEELLQTKSVTGYSPEVTPALANRINSLRGGGQPLDPATRAFMEPRFGWNLGQIRVHTDSRAVQMNDELNAQAFTHGNDIYFADGKYHPHTSTSRHLLAHELTHTVQQSQAMPKKIPKLGAAIHTEMDFFPRGMILPNV